MTVSEQETKRPRGRPKLPAKDRGGQFIVYATDAVRDEFDGLRKPDQSRGELIEEAIPLLQGKRRREARRADAAQEEAQP